MSELLKDNSGPFKPDLKHSDFCKEFLDRMMPEWSKAFNRLEEMCAQSLKKRIGQKVDAQFIEEWEQEAWVRHVEQNHTKIAKALNMVPKNILDVMRLIQVIPDGAAVESVYQPMFEVKNENHVILTFSRCRPLEWFEKQNLLDRIRSECKADCVIMPRVATVWFPNAEVKPLWMPPFDRLRTEEERAKPPCAWEYKLKST